MTLFPEPAALLLLVGAALVMTGFCVAWKQHCDRTGVK